MDVLSRLVNLTGLSLLLAVAMIAYSGWSLYRHHRRQDLFYLLIGLYLAGLQTPAALDLLVGASPTCPLGGPTSGLLRLAPAAVLLVLAFGSD